MCFLDRKKEYSVPGPLLQAIQSLYERSESCVHVPGIKLSVFSVGVGLCQSCPLSLILDFHGQGLVAQPRPGVHPNQEPQDYISRFAAECEDQHTLPENSGLLSLGRARVTATSREFKYLGVL